MIPADYHPSIISSGLSKGHLMRKLAILVLITALAMIVAGCGTPESPLTNTAGALAIGEDEPVIIAVAGGMGIAGVAEEGLSHLHAAELAAIDFGGRIEGHPIKIVGIDSGCTTQDSQIAAEEIVSRADVAGVIGHMCSSECLAAVNVYTEAGISTISPACEANSLTEPISHQSSFLRTIYNSELEAYTSARFAYNTLGARRIAVIHDKTGNSEELTEDFINAFTSLGGEVALSVEELIFTSTWINTLFAEMGSLGIDLIYAPLEPFDSLFLINHREYIDLEIPIMGSHRLVSSWYLKQVEPDIEGIYATAPLIPESDRLDAFNSDYEENFGTPPPSPTTILSYDATLMLLNAINETATSSGRTLYLSRADIADQLYLTTALTGISGSLTCTEWGKCGAVIPAVYKIIEGGWGKVYIP